MGRCSNMKGRLSFDLRMRQAAEQPSSVLFAEQLYRRVRPTGSGQYAEMCAVQGPVLEAQNIGLSMGRDLVLPCGATARWTP